MEVPAHDLLDEERVALDGLDLLRVLEGHEADERLALDDRVAGVALAEHRLDQVGDAHLRPDGVDLGDRRHDVADGDALERRLHHRLLGLAGGADVDEEGDADEDDVELQQAEQPEQQREALADLGGDLRRPGVRPVPGEQRAEHAAAVHRERGQEVEARQRDVHQREVADDEPRRRQARRDREVADPADDPEGDADDRPGDGDGQLLAPGLGHLAELGDAAEDPERDRLDRVAEAHRHQRVAQLVEDDAGEQPDGGGDPQDPRGGAAGERRGVEGGAAQLGQLAGPELDLRADDPREQREHQQEGEVELQRDAEDRPDPELAHHPALGVAST